MGKGGARKALLVYDGAEESATGNRKWLIQAREAGAPFPSLSLPLPCRLVGEIVAVVGQLHRSGRPVPSLGSISSRRRQLSGIRGPHTSQMHRSDAQGKMAR